MAIKKIFKSRISSINYVTKAGQTCPFVEGRYLTDVPEEIMELSELVASGKNAHIFIDENEHELDTSLQDAIKAAQAKAVIEVMAEFAAKKNQAGNQGESNGAQTGTQTSQVAKQTMTPAALVGAVKSPVSLMNPAMAAQSNTK